ncbi:hypothetical protein SVIOM342S_09860 [Streptomyces violaceorubidus]
MSFLNEYTRRRFLGSAAAVGSVTAVATVVPAAPTAGAAVPQAGRGGACGPATGLVQVGRTDRRYRDLVSRGFNGRFRGEPDTVYVVHTADQVVDAVDRALKAGRRIAVRSGGHCFEGFATPGPRPCRRGRRSDAGARRCRRRRPAARPPACLRARTSPATTAASAR